MRLLRFEVKIVLAILLVAIAPLIASVTLGRSVLQDAYRVGVNQRVRRQLEASLTVYRDYFRASRREADAIADVLAARVVVAGLCGGDEPDHDALTGLVEPYPSLRSARLVRKGSTVPCAVVTRASELGDESIRTLALERKVVLASSTGTETPIEHLLTVTLSTDARPFAAYEEAGQVAEVYRQLKEQDEYLSGKYWSLYILCLGLVIALAALLAGVAARRVTSRIALLIEATKRVGSGDLTVAVPAGRQDEIAELSGSFNKMVHDLGDSRARVEYLNRVSGWQEFAKRLAHEIKNPLTPIQLAAQEIERRFAGDDHQHRQALSDARAIIEEEVATLRRLVGEFSSFAKLPEVRLSAANLGEFLEELRSLVPSIEADLESAVAIDLKLPQGTGPEVALDGMLLRRCFDNLFRNAAQAARDAGNEQVRISVSLTLRDTTVVLMVTDTGPGMDEDTQNKMFQPHFTTKKDGSGLGLAIVKKIVLEHHGDITCDSVTDAGTRFKIELPVNAPPQP